MNFDLNNTYEFFNKLSPKLSLKMAAKTFGLISPFNSHLKSKLTEWSHSATAFEVKSIRSVRNHLGGIHAGALFTLGESCAGLIIVKNFDFSKYRPILVSASIDYVKQVRTKAHGRAEISSSEIERAKTGLEKGEIQFLDFETQIKNEKNELACVCKTRWQVKRWDQVRALNNRNKP